jgi:hypothetical protein
MGADLIVFILKGPTKITKASIKKAERRATEIILFASKVYEAIRTRDEALNGNGRALNDEERELFRTALNNPLLAGFNAQEQHSSTEECEDMFEKMAASTAKDEVEKFVEWWESPIGRDTSFRQDPDDKRKQIVVCGDSTWGDGPNGGEGYDLVNEAYWYDIPQNLGVM